MGRLFRTFSVFQTDECFLSREPRVAGQSVAATIVRRRQHYVLQEPVGVRVLVVLVNLTMKEGSGMEYSSTFTNSVDG